MSDHARKLRDAVEVFNVLDATLEHLIPFAPNTTDEARRDAIEFVSGKELQSDLHAAADALEAAEAKLAAIEDLCARHGITVEGIVALVDDTFRPITEPEHADITEAVEAGLNRDDMYYAGWEVGYFDAVNAARRLVLGEEA